MYERRCPLGRRARGRSTHRRSPSRWRRRLDARAARRVQGGDRVHGVDGRGEPRAGELETGRHGPAVDDYPAAPKLPATVPLELRPRESRPRTRAVCTTRRIRRALAAEDEVGPAPTRDSHRLRREAVGAAPVVVLAVMSSNPLVPGNAASAEPVPLSAKTKLAAGVPDPQAASAVDPTTKMSPEESTRGRRR